MGRPAKYPPQDFNGTRYYRKPRGYFKSDDGVYIHRAVWIFHNGPIPPGHDVHHADDDKSNNVIGNLECLTKAEHASHHGRKRLPKGSEEARVHMEVIRPAASAWHGSDAGKQWHKDHGKRTWEDRKSEDLRCTHCGGAFSALVGTAKRGFCSAACQSAARRASGIDDEHRMCSVCGNGFTVNKYARTKTCSPPCAKVQLSRSKRGL